MPLMRSLAPVRLAHGSGHVVIVTPEGSHVPDLMVDFAMERGCVSVEAEQKTAVAKKAAAKKESFAQTKQVRREKIKTAIKGLMIEGNESNFLPTGAPRVRAVRDACGDDSVTAEEVGEIMVAPDFL